MPLPPASFAADLPEVTRQQARQLVVSTGVFWACFAVAGPLIDRPTAILLFLPALPAAVLFYATLFKVWGARLFVVPNREMFRETGKQQRAMFSLFRPRFVRHVFRATDWPPALVGCVLAALLGGAVLSTTVFAPQDQPVCDTRDC